VSIADRLSICFIRSGPLTVARQDLRTQARRFHDDPQCSNQASIAYVQYESTITKCVIPRELLIDIYRSRLAELDPDIMSVVMVDPRETESET